jgi:hypothetical protein
MFFELHHTEVRLGLMALPFLLTAILLYTNYKVNTIANG